LNREFYSHTRVREVIEVIVKRANLFSKTFGRICIREHNNIG